MSDIKEGEKQDEIQSTQAHTIGKQNVLIVEREIKNDAVHKDQITGAQNLNEDEFMTCSIENSFKVWNKNSQTCIYTIETHEPLHTMAVTGEKGDMLVASLGQGNLIVFGMELKNQIDIINEAHVQPVIKVISLNKLANKYFATRCAEGHVNVWSATTHPDRLFTIENIDKEETAQAENALNFTIKQDQQEQMQNSLWTSSSSAKDRMVELKWDNSIQKSSTVLCVTNYNDSMVIIVAIDLKTRKKTIIKTFQTQNRPSFVYQVDDNNILIGTEGGFIEQWVLYEYRLANTYEAHPGSELGVSSIIELNTSNYLLWGDIEEKERDQYKLIATAANGCNEFKIWKFYNQEKLIPHMKINTSCVQGITILLQTSETQMIAVDSNKTLRFYNFIDHKLKQEEEEKEKDIEKLNQAVRKVFTLYDQDQSGYLEQKEVMRFLGDVFKECYGKKIAIDETLLNFFDFDQDQRLSRQEVRHLVQALRRDHIHAV